MSQHREKYEDVTWVLSALIEMIDETVYHTHTFAHTLRSHSNDQAAKVFFLAYEQFKTEKEIVSEHARNFDLPKIPPWEVPFPEYQHPSSHLTEAHYEMTENDAREAIGRMIGVHKTFYACLRQENSIEKVVSCVDQLMKHHEEWE